MALSLKTIPNLIRQTSSRLKVACLISGGVDSCVAALLLKRLAFDVIGVHLNVWNDFDFKEGVCHETDRNDARFVCDKLGIEFKEVDFVQHYWNHVFIDFLKAYESGETPNPDMFCNRKIKFGVFLDYAVKNLNMDAIASGHYAGTSLGPFWEYRQQHITRNEHVELIRPKDKMRDQTFFLSQIEPSSLKKVLFPLQTLMKEEVRKIAIENGFERIAKRKPTTGICFIGKRNFQNFINEYIEPKPGKMIDIDTREIIREHNGLHQWTLGQRCTHHSKPVKYFIAHKCLKSNNIYVAAGEDHPSLYSNEFTAKNMHWLTEEPIELRQNELKCLFKFQQKEDLSECTVTKLDNNTLQFKTKKLQRCLTPGQIAVLYKGEKCLGGAKIISYKNEYVAKFL
ncbi:mitochondrial tRNA-specific 2-thiouridylase 1-like isoform X1 [Dinothrombium tinctorium]|uniref:tRNA-5-taurinomethyluridine 2-sulfurtransferase n=1 Tax=Dinothrombium tinctorium TaxID=1965070 RepID=A0A443Q947_9ACAR|nr:mitochondrial tRNA-specific 2-thiouridylase 1-like isoform X1 [Dinothrombium tinctorium]RWR99935.1 mitochondrial tRNA-specific 2-thiouridylase 1-like isoform X1 [Dinothrombium tinctorium]